MASEHNSGGRDATRTILEDVCSDFETMNVVAPKSNKVGVIKNFRTRSSVQQNVTEKNSDTNIQKSKDSSSKTSVVTSESSDKTLSSAVNKKVTNKISAIGDISSSNSVVNTETKDQKSLVVTNVNANVVSQNKVELDKTLETSVATGTEHLQPSTTLASATELSQSSVLNTESNVHFDSGLLPLNNSQETSNVTIVPENFAVDQNLSSLAQLADAEIVQSGDNVSIIVSNPRFIEVLTNASTPISTLESGTMIETPAAVLDTGIGSTQQIEFVDSSLLTDSTIQDITIADDLNFIQENSSKTGIQSKDLKSPKKEGRGRGRPPKSSISSRKTASSPPPSYIPSTPFTRGRRVTSRMKAAWTRLLEMDGHLVCQMPGCSQKFVTVANFQTHFKYCSGKKTLKKCDYCDSMIFSTHKAILQHMEVEHPEKAEEYRAAHQEEILEFEKNNAPDHLIISEDENVAMNIEEITQSTPNISRKRKLSEKETMAPNKKVILKHKLQSIQNSMAENAKEFKKCVRFDSITDAIKSVKISSLEEACKIEPPVKKPDKRSKRVFTEKIVAADKYFEDDEDVDQPKSEEELQKEKQELRERMHTKARLMLNLERYKRYQEYLTVTRDWSSERKTYSRSRGSDMSAENSFNVQMLNESFQDIHQLNSMTESSNISLNTPEAEINSIQMTPVETYQVVETPEFVSAVALQPDDVLTSTPKNINTMSLNFSPSESELIQPFTYGENRIRREKTACYNRVNFENPKPKPKLGGIITYGAQIPSENVNKPIEPPVTFDSLVNFMKPKTVRRNSQAEGIENIPKPDKEDSASDVIAANPKKRGRPPKSKINSNIETKVAKGSQKTTKKQKGRAKKYSAAMLKTIEKNVKNKKVRLFGIKKNLKSKKYASMQSKKHNLKNIRLKQSKNKLISVETNIKNKRQKQNKTKSKHKTKLVDESAIQCQENIDNHLSLGQGLNISGITCLSTEHNYTNTLNQLIVDANIAGEIEIAASNTEQLLEIVTDKSVIFSENVSNENVCPEPANKEIEHSDLLNSLTINSQISENNLPQNATEAEINNEEKLKDINSEKNANDQRKNHPLETPNDSVIPIQMDNDLSENLTQKDAESIDAKTKMVQKDYESTGDAGIKMIQKDSESNDTDVKQVQNDTENNAEANHIQKGAERSDADPELIQNDFENNISVDVSTIVDNLIEKISSSHQNLSNFEHTTIEQLNSINEPLNDTNINNTERLSESHEVPSSDANKAEDMVPEIPVKRGRGRPRKNSKKATPKNSNCKSSQQNNLKDHELKESKITDDSATVCADVSNNNIASEPLNNFADDDNKTIPGIRKSERVRRRKLVDDEIFQTPVTEIKQKEVTPTNKQTGKTRRGRPRKDQESLMETTGTKEEESKQETPEIESECLDENLRKFSRKGRPRKCVRYADLNSGLESSESMDGIHSTNAGKDKSESTKLKNSKNVKKARKSDEVTELPTDSKEQEENIVLPLKKRKQRQTKKNDSELEKSKQNHVIDDEIALLSAGEENQDKLNENEDSSEKRNLRSRKRGTKRKKHGSDTSDEEWDPEVHLKSTGKSSGRKSLINILELEETSDSSSSERRDPTFSKKEGDAIRKFLKSAKAKRIDVAAAKYSLKTSEELFVEYKPQKYMWKILSGDDFVLPPMKTSPYFKIEKAWQKTEAYWNTLSLFDSVPLDNDSCHGTFFTGGPVTCSAWCPIPSESNKIQYVAVAVSSLMNKVHSYFSEELEAGFLQLWNVGDLRKNVLQREPFMELSIFHKYGPINDMVWCPYGCWENPETKNSSDILPRLGLLAVACSDSNIRIYSIPHPHLLPKEGTSLPIYSASPSVILECLYGDICFGTRKSVCVSLSWQRTDHCERIAAGYGCGMICVWHVNTTATVLASKENNQIIIKPYLVFNGHGTPVSGISFSPLPGGRFLVSASIDKTLKFWDLIDTSLPVYTVKKGAGKWAHWSSYYCGAFGSIQHGMNNFKGSTFFKECGTETISSRSLSHPNCSISLCTLSEWLNALAIGDIAGSLSVSFTHSLIHEYTKGPQYFQRYVYESELKPVEGIVDKIIFSSYPESVNCIKHIQDMKEISLLLDETVSLVCGVNDIVENSITLKITENHSQNSCHMALDNIKEVIEVVHHILENNESITLNSKADAAVNIQQDILQTTCVDDSEKVRHYDDERGSKLDEVVSDKLSGIADIVTLIVDINDATETVDKLVNSSEFGISHIISSNSTTDMTSDISLMNVHNSEDLNEIIKHSSDALQSSLDIIELLDFLVNVVNENEDSYKLSNTSEKVTGDSIVTDIHLENIAYISAIDEMSNIVAIVETMAENCSKLHISEISAENENVIAVIPSESIAVIDTMDEILNIVTVMENMADNCHNSEFISEFCNVLSEKDDGEMQSYDFETVGCVLQKIKDVIITTEDITKTYSKLKSEHEMDQNLKISKFGQYQLSSLTISLNELASKINDTKDNKHIYNRIEQSHNLSETLDVVCAVSDIQDTTDTVLSMKDTIEVISVMKDASEVVSDMKDTIEVISAIKDETGAIFDMRDTTEVLSDIKDTTEVLSDIKDTTEILSDMKDTTEVLLDMKDMTEILSDMKDTAEVVCNLKTITETVLDMKDIILSSGDLNDTISCTEDLKDVTIVTEKLENKITGISSEHVVSSLINEIVGHVSKEDFESVSTMENLISNSQMLINCTYHEIDLTAKEKSRESFEVPSLIDITEMEEDVIKCDSNLSKKFDYPLPELTDEMDEQMLSASESSNSDNDMDTDDEMDVGDSYVFEQDSNLTDDSILSEWSLDSAASLCSFSTESDMSIDSCASIQGEQETDALVSSHQNNVTGAVKTPSESSPQSTNLTFEGKIISTSENNMENNSEDIIMDVSDLVESSKDSNAEMTMQETSVNLINDSNVPDSQNVIVPDDKQTFEKVNKISSSSAFSEVEQVSTNSEIASELISDQTEPKPVTADDAVIVDSSDKSDNLSHITNAPSEMPCGNSICSTETANIPINSSTETCIESIEKNANDTDVSSFQERLPDSFNNPVLPETIENISEQNEITEVHVVHSEKQSVYNSASSASEPCVEIKKRIPESFSCFEDVIAEYGIVFKDKNTAKFDKIEQENFKEMNEYSFNRYNLTSIKAVSWNPNHGSHHWLLSAGHSGIARLSYISDIFQANSDKKAK